MVSTSFGILRFAGSDEEIGVQQGRELKTHIHDIQRIVRGLDDMKMAKPISVVRKVAV